MNELDDLIPPTAYIRLDGQLGMLLSSVQKGNWPSQFDHDQQQIRGIPTARKRPASEQPLRCPAIASQVPNWRVEPRWNHHLSVLN